MALGLLTVLGVTGFAAEVGQDEFMVTGGFGLSGSAYTSYDGYTLGDQIFDDPTSFEASSTPDVVSSWNLGVVYSYYPNSNVSIDLGLTYSSQPFSVRYRGDASPDDLVFLSRFQLLKVPVLLTGHWDWFTLGAGLSYQKILGNDSTVSLGTESVESPLKDAEDVVSFVVQPGLSFDVDEVTSLRLFLRYDQDLTEIYSTPYWVTEVKLIDISANLGVAFEF